MIIKIYKNFYKSFKKLFTSIKIGDIIILTKGKENPQNQKEIKNMKNITHKNIIKQANEVKKRLLEVKNNNKTLLLYELYWNLLEKNDYNEGVYYLDDIDGDTLIKWIEERNMIELDPSLPFIYRGLHQITSIKTPEAVDEIYTTILHEINTATDFYEDETIIKDINTITDYLNNIKL